MLFTRSKWIVVSALLIASITIQNAAVTSAAPTSSISSMNDLEFDENNKLRSHTVLYTGNTACRTMGLPSHKAAKHNVFEATGDALDKVFPMADKTSSCKAVCIERGVDRSVVDAVMPHMRFDSASPDNENTFSDWFDATCSRKEICLMNYHDKNQPLTLNWVKPDGSKQFHLSILYGEKNTKCFGSFLGHKFVAEDANGNVVGAVEVEHVTVMAFGKAPPSDDIGRHNFDVEIEKTLKDEWERHKRVTRTFSPLGFKKGRLPRDVFGSMGAFYYNNRNNKVIEEWDNRGVFVNWWETDVYVIPLPWALRDLWQGRLLDMVEAWAGVPVEQTVMYGLREYTDGARLLTHVDRRLTHAVSLIVNIAQGNLTSPWPVEVQDHADRMHEVLMEPGDVVYYESAKCLHGRNRPLPGGYYANLFTHYRPTGYGDEWYSTPNHKGTPEAVLDDVVGECKLVPMGLTDVGKGKLGLVEGVKCDDPRLGDHISPTLFQAKNADDLIKWWRMTAPEESGGSASMTEEL